MSKWNTVSIRVGDWVTTAQVALESIINNPDAFAPDTILAAYAVAQEVGVHEMYLEMAQPMVEAARKMMV